MTGGERRKETESEKKEFKKTAPCLNTLNANWIVMMVASISNIHTGVMN